jgi:hypothetical protein
MGFFFSAFFIDSGAQWLFLQMACFTESVLFVSVSCFRFWDLFGFGLLKVLLSVWVVLFFSIVFAFCLGRKE